MPELTKIIDYVKYYKIHKFFIYYLFLSSLTKTENLTKLIENVVTLPSEDINEKTRFRYSSISCELLTSDIPCINDAIINNTPIMDKLYSFIETEETLNPLLASYFTKVMSCLIKRKTESVSIFIDMWIQI